MDPTPPSAVVTPRFSVTIDSRLELVAVVADLTRIACASIGLALIKQVMHEIGYQIGRAHV